MEIRIVSVGKIKEKYLSAGIAEYAKRLSRYCKLTFCQVPDEKTPDKASETLNQQIKDTEGERLLKHIREQDGAVRKDRTSWCFRCQLHCLCDRRLPGAK